LVLFCGKCGGSNLDISVAINICTSIFIGTGCCWLLVCLFVCLFCNFVCVGFDHYTQTNTSNINKTRPLPQRTGGLLYHIFQFYYFQISKFNFQYHTMCSSRFIIQNMTKKYLTFTRKNWYRC
jgi:hypothetical protein